MSVNPIDFLAIAEELIGGSSEIHYRCAASRAYYSAYHRCLDIGDALLGGEDETVGKHERLIRKLANYPKTEEPKEVNMKIRALGHMLSQARNIRTTADYKLLEDFPLNKAKEVFLTVRRIEQNSDIVEQSLHG